MNYEMQLRRQREALNLTEEQAAEKAGLSLGEYRDHEHGLHDSSLPERFGMLVALDMDRQRAMQIASAPDILSLADMTESLEYRADNPLVREEDDAFVLYSREDDDHEYTILKQRVRTPENIIGWIDHMGSKRWVTRRHLKLFASMAAHHLKLNIHPLP